MIWFDKCLYSMQVLVGRSASDEMKGWREHEHVLRSFGDGVTRLLVATSIFEEGLDVSSCHLVIR